MDEENGGLMMEIEKDKIICEMFENLQPEDTRPPTAAEKERLDHIIKVGASNWYAKKGTKAEAAHPTDSRIKVPA